MGVRVVVVDDDEWVRRGRAAALAETTGVELLAALDHAGALAQPELWQQADVVLVDAWDRRAGFDRFPGVKVVREVRRLAGGRAVTIVVVTGCVVNDLLRLRMAQAGADFFYGHEEVADPSSLAQVVLTTPRSARPGGGAWQEGPDAALDWIREQSLEAAFEGGPQKLLPFSRRRLITARRQIGRRSGLGSGKGLPSWRQIVAFVDQARGAEMRRRSPTDPDRDGH